tara:strand:+ start:1136 stop:1666 length:531 start_codon:yes stop_codon:yes gene_type:complete
VTCGEIDIQMGAKPILKIRGINMLKLEDEMLETNRAIVKMQNVSFISWKKYNNNKYEVFITVKNQSDQITQMLTDDELLDLKKYYAECAKKNSVISERPDSELLRVNQKISIEDGILIDSHRCVVDLALVEFITIKENYYTGEYIIKLHFQNKEVRLYLGNYDEVESIIGIWTQYR